MKNDNKPIRVDPDGLMDTTIKSSDVSAEDVTLLAKKNQSDLRHLNIFLVSKVNHQCFELPEVCKGYY